MGGKMWPGHAATRSLRTWLRKRLNNRLYYRKTTIEWRAGKLRQRRLNGRDYSVQRACEGEGKHRRRSEFSEIQIPVSEIETDLRRAVRNKNLIIL